MSTKKEKCCENLCYCGKDTTIGHFKGVEGCVQSESIDLDGIDNKITDLVQRLPFEKRGEIWTLIHESRKQAITTAVEAREREIESAVEKLKESYNGKCVKPEYYIESRWKDRDEGARTCCDKVLSVINPSKE